MNRDYISKDSCFISAHVVNDRYYFSSFYAYFSLLVVDHFKFISVDQNSGKKIKLYGSNVLMNIPKQVILH